MILAELKQSADGRLGLGPRLLVWKSQGVDRDGEGVRANLSKTLQSVIFVAQACATEHANFLLGLLTTTTGTALVDR